MSDDHELFEVHQYFEQLQLRGKRRPIIGNERSRMLVTLIYPFRGVSVILRGESGSAKSTIVRGAVALCFGPSALDDAVPEVLLWGGSSDKALLTEDNVGRIDTRATHCIIPELEFVLTQDRGYDIVKVWTENEPYPYDRASDFGKHSERIILRPLPILTSVANESLKLKDLAEEMERRFMPLYTESNREMNERIHRRKAEIEAYPDDMMFQETAGQVVDLREHITKTIKMDIGGVLASRRPRDLDAPDPIGIKNPCAPYMSKVVPKRFTISNTYIDYWFDMVKSIAIFYHPQRPIYERRAAKYLMAAPVDNYLAWHIGGQAIVDASLRLRDLGHVLMKIIPTLEYRYGGELSVSADAVSLDRIVDEISNKGYERSKPQIKELLMRLVMANYVKVDDKDRYWKTQNYGDEFVTGINWQECINETKKVVSDLYPEIASDYISQYCDDPVFVDPFTGKKMRLLDVTSEEKGAVEEVITKKKKMVRLDDLN